MATKKSEITCKSAKKVEVSKKNRNSLDDGSLSLKYSKMSLYELVNELEKNTIKIHNNQKKQLRLVRELEILVNKESKS